MTDAQRDQFDQQGYLIVPNALDEATLERLLEASDRVDREEREKKALDPGATMAKFRTMLFELYHRAGGARSGNHWVNHQRRHILSLFLLKHC